MRPFVLLQNIRRRKTTTAHVTQMLPNAGVNGHVRTQRGLFVESPIADLTNKWLDS